MIRLIDMRQERYGPLVVQSPAEGDHRGARWHVRCERCGETFIVSRRRLRYRGANVHQCPEPKCA